MPVVHLLLLQIVVCIPAKTSSLAVLSVVVLLLKDIASKDDRTHAKVAAMGAMQKIPTSTQFCNNKIS